MALILMMVIDRFVPYQSGSMMPEQDMIICCQPIELEPGAIPRVASNRRRPP